MPRHDSTTPHTRRIPLRTATLFAALFTSLLPVILALPEAIPNALAAPAPEAAPDPDPDPEPAPDAVPQDGTTYVIPFSGAIYVTVPNQNASPAVPAVCPAAAPVACSAIQQPNYCCPSGNYCGWVAGQVGCCPTGQTCNGLGGGGGGGSNTVWQDTTTVAVWAPSTTTYWYASSTTSYCPPGGGGYGDGGAGLCQSPTPYVQPQWTPGAGTTTVYVAGGGGYVQPQVTTTVYGAGQVVTTTYDNGQYTNPAVVGGAGAATAGAGSYCSTLYADGPGLPTTKAGQCGTILVLPASSTGHASIVVVGWGLLMAGLGAHVFWWR